MEMAKTVFGSCSVGVCYIAIQLLVFTHLASLM